MQIIDPKFHNNIWRYMGQCLLTALAMLLLFYLLDAAANAAVLASLGASAFIAFTMPHYQVSRPRYLIGGYAVGITIGVVCNLIRSMDMVSSLPISEKTILIAFATIALGLSIFTMVVSNFEHPPAAAVAVGLVLNNSSGTAIIIVAFGIVGLAAIKTILKPIMIDLL